MEYYILLACLAMVGYGILSLLYKVFGSNFNPITFTFLMSLGMTLVLFVAHLLMGKQEITRGALVPVAIGLLSGLVLLSYVSAIRFGKVSIASTLRGLSFIVATILAVALLREQLSLIKVVAIILGAIALVLLAF